MRSFFKNNQNPGGRYTILFIARAAFEAHVNREMGR
jgi:hypothetical protein